MELASSTFWFHLAWGLCVYLPVGSIQILFPPRSEVNSHSRVRLSATPWTVAHQAPPSLEFSRQEYWRGLPFPSPGDLPDPGIELGSPALQADALELYHLSHQESTSHLGGILVSTKQLQDIVMYILWGGTKTLSQGFTIVSWLLLPLSPHLLPSQISKCLNFPLGTQGKSWRLKGQGKNLYPGEPLRGLISFSSHNYYLRSK